MNELKSVWVVHDNEWHDILHKPMKLYCTTKYFFSKLKYGFRVSINKDGYIIKAKKDYIGYIVKKGRNLSLRENYTLFNKLYKKLISQIVNGKIKINNKKCIF